MSASTSTSIASLLDTISTITVATLDTHGQPQAASLFFVSDAALNVYWVSGPKSRHSQNLARNPRAALTAHANTWTWTEIAGVQMEGTVAVVPAGPTWQAVWERYLVKFSFVADFEAEVSRSNFYHFTPTWARLIDNRRGFGYKEETQFG